jgi:OOP family OmpA-OmpF porin
MIRTALVLLLLPGAAAALTLNLPAGAEATFEAAETGSVRLPTGVFRDDAVPVTGYSGRISRQAWRLEGAASTGQLIGALEAQLRDAGFTVTALCETRACGGFDFRFAVEVIEEPAMHVDLGDFRYLAAERATPEGVEAVSLLVSRAPGAGYVQIVAVEPGGEDPASSGPGVEVATAVEVPEAPEVFEAGALVEVLEARGHVVLDDLAFDTGSSDLGEGSYASLAELSAYLKAHPGRTVVVVGHTDAVGGLDGNVALSRRRAASVKDRLTGKYGVPAAQVGADGVGYLAPRASNLTEAGREQNRRVEVVLTSTE